MAQEQEDQLYKVFTNVNEWLKFSEAKNAMLVAFNGASIYGVAQALGLECLKDKNWVIPYFSVVIVLLIVSTITSLISFVPKVKMFRGTNQNNASVSNVLFFEYLKTKTQTQILEEITEKSAATHSFTTLEKDLAEQIKQNSIIASMKFSFFSIAIWITVAAYITVPFAAIFLLYNYLKS